MKIIEKGFPANWNPKLTKTQKANMQKWVNELRTTEKPQSTNLLKTELGYCCLGIACELFYGEAHWVTDSTHNCYTSKDKWSAALPPGACKKLGTDSNPYIPHGYAKGVPCLGVWDLNDSAKLSFKEIADVLDWAYLDGEKPGFYELR